MVSALAKPITSPSGHDAACATLSAHTASVRQQRDAEDRCKGLPSYVPCAMSTRLGDLSEELRKLETERVSNACSPPPPGESCAEIEAELKLSGPKLSADVESMKRICVLKGRALAVSRAGLESIDFGKHWGCKSSKGIVTQVIGEVPISPSGEKMMSRADVTAGLLGSHC